MQLKTYLEKDNTTQEQFAETLGVAQATVNRWINGTRMPRPAHMRRIAEVTGGEVTANDFVGEG